MKCVAFVLLVLYGLCQRSFANVSFDENASGALNITASNRLQPLLVNGVDVLGVLRELLFSFPPVFNSSNFATLHSSNVHPQWNEGVLAGDGKIYAIPLFADSILIIDPATNLVSSKPVTSGDSQPNAKWNGAVLAENGKVYGIPRSTSDMLIIDPFTGNYELKTIENLELEDGQIGGVLANNKIYRIPSYTTKVVIFDIETNMTDSNTISGQFLEGDAKWIGGVVANNGKIYTIPFNSPSILVIDSNDDTTEFLQLPYGADENGKWSSGTRASNGKIYAIPYQASAVLVIDPNTHDLRYLETGLNQHPLFWGAVVSWDGRIYGVPNGSASVIVVDPRTNHVRVHDEVVPSSAFHADMWRGGVLAPNGHIYLIPAKALTVAMLTMPEGLDELF
eukprot:gene3336-8265_t